MIFDLDIGIMIHLDSIYVKFEGQDNRSKFKVTRGKRAQQLLR